MGTTLKFMPDRLIEIIVEKMTVSLMSVRGVSLLEASDKKRRFLSWVIAFMGTYLRELKLRSRLCRFGKATPMKFVREL